MNYDSNRYMELREKIDALPRRSLGSLPTPLHEVPNLTAHLGGPRIWFKRDDLTGLAMGGNKTRMLEFRLVKAVCEGADTVIAGYGVQSNHARQIAAACSRLGMECHLVLKEGTDRYEKKRAAEGNMLLYDLLGAKVVLTDAPVAGQIQQMKDLAAKLRREGRRPHVTGVDDYELSSIAYADCMLEMCKQFDAQGVDPDYVVVCSEGPTQAGLVVASRYLGMKTRIIGITPMHNLDRPGRNPDIKSDIVRLGNLCAGMLDLPLEIKAEDVVNHSRYVGEGYGIVNRETVDAVRTVARTEGVLLDPVYTGKAMAGLMDLVRREEIGKDAQVVFIHTGGTPLLFLYGNELV